MKPNNQSETKVELELDKNKLKSNKGPYILGEKLGEGAFAKVRIATQIHIKEKCAVKIFEKKLLEGSRDVERLKKEIKILKKLRHKNIIQLYDIMESKHNLYFVMEYCKNGELFDYIVKKKRLKESEACIFFQQLINGVEYLHKQGIIHRDLKPENLLLDDRNHIKISDFGLSAFFTKNNYLQTACGTPSYAPPEMLEGNEYNGEATDVWSCGIILYAMLCGTLPISESKEEIIVKKIKMHDYIIPNYLSKEAKDLINHILIINPKERYNIKQIQNHPWFNLIKPHMVPGINFDEDIIPVDNKILDMVKNFGFDTNECKEQLLKNKFCSLTTIYYLCLKKYVRENGKSISDLESELFEEYIKNPNNKIKKLKNNKENELNGLSDMNNKIERNNNHINNIRLPIKKINQNNSNKKNNGINNNHNNKNNDITNLNYIKLGSDKRNLMSTKNIKKGCLLTESNTNKENFIKEKISTCIDKKYNKNISPIKKKIETKTIEINKINLSKNQINENDKDEYKTKSSRKKKLKIINTNIKNKNNLSSSRKPKAIKQQTEKKLLTSKFILNEETTKRESNKDNQINTNVNIINININNNQVPLNYNKEIPMKNQNNPPNISNYDNNFSDKDLSFLLQQKLNAMNQFKNKCEINPENKINEINHNNVNLKEDEDELKALLNSINIKDGNSISIINQNNTFSTLYNNNSNLFNSIFQDSVNMKQTKTFVDISKNNYSINTENNIINSNNSRPKSSLYQYLGNDIEKYMFMKGEKPINVINYIAKKLVATSFCGSFGFQNRYNNSYINNNINQMGSFFKKSSEDNNCLRKSNGNFENKNDNSFENNNSTIKDTSLFVNDDNDSKDLNFKNLVSILNKKFKSYISNEKLNKSEVHNKNNINENNNNNNINNLGLNTNKNSFINNIKNDENKNSLFKSFNFRKASINDNEINNNKKDDNSYIALSYSKKDKIDNKLSKINKTSIKCNKDQTEKSKVIKNNLDLKNISYAHSSKINNYYSNHKTFLDISTNYEPNIDSRNSSIERSISIKKKEIRNFSCSPSHEKKKIKDKNIIKNGQIINITKRNKNFNIISEDDEFKDITKKNITKSNNKKKKKTGICQNKVTINLSINDDKCNSNCKKGSSKLKKIITKKNDS